MNPVTLRAGDIVLTGDDGIIGRMIRLCTRVPWWEKGSQWNHSYLIVQGGPWREAKCIGAGGHGVVEHDVWADQRSVVWRPLNLTDAQRSLIVDAARASIGRPYGYSKIVAWWLDWLCGLGLVDIAVWRRLCHDPEFQFCTSSLHIWNSFGEGAGKDFGVGDPVRVSPDCIADFAETHPDYYERIAFGKPEAW